MKAQKRTDGKRTPASNKGGRPARPMPELIPDTPENIARASMMGPPKEPKEWGYLKKLERHDSEIQRPRMDNF